jgi:undecaprenyl-diphosphatase
MSSDDDRAHRLSRYSGWILLVFIGVLLPLWGFGALADGLRDGETFTFDVPLLQAAHSIANARVDQAFLIITSLGYVRGVVPVDAILVLVLALAKRPREAVFAGISILGSLVLNLAVKHSFERARPSLWETLVHETSYSFPSGHAMASMTLGWVAVLLCWSKQSRIGWRLRWPVTCVAATFVLLVGLSRIYLGAHYPSDILAGWTAASVWVIGVYVLTFYGAESPVSNKNPSSISTWSQWD